jgi:hypothetical protein
MDIDTRLLAYLLWGVGTTLVYGIVLRGRYRAFRVRLDPRARRELMVAFGLFLTALMANLAILLVLFGTPGTGIRGFAVAVALGAFAATGLVMATDEDS